MRTPINNLGSPLQKLGAPPGGAVKDDLKKVDSKGSEGDNPPLFEDVLESRNEPQPKEVASSGAREKAPVGFESPRREEVGVKIPVEKRTEVPIARPVKQETVQGSKAETQEKAQVLMLNFMDSMESELGIAPAEIVVAMSQLNNQDLMLPPEETMEQVIGQFDLDDGETDIAVDLYGDLLVGLAALKAEPQVTSDAWAGGAWSDPQMMGRAGAVTAGMMMMQQQPQINQLPQNTLPQRLPGQQMPLPQPLTPKEKKEALNASLDKMNSKFFMQEPKAMPQQEMSLASDGFQTSMQDSKMMSQSSEGRISSEGKMALPEGMKAVEPKMVAPQSAAEPVMLDVQAMDVPMKPEAKLVATTAGLAAQAMKAMPKAEVRSAEALSVDPAQMQVGMNTDVMPMNVLSKANAQGSNNDLMSFSDKGSSLEDSDLKSLSDSSSKEGDPFAVSKDIGQKADPLRGNDAKSLAAGGATGAMLGARHNQSDPNVQALMNRAQILIRDGGGEMKVKMTPEGMGTVDLKVAVQNGKVNVEMLADSPHAKKLIESASSDLKSHLVESKLDVGTIKVDLASRSSTNLDNPSSQQQQKQMDSQADQRGREQAQQFFNQFREGNLSQRGAMTELPDFRSYSPRKSVAMEPAKRPDPTARKNEGGRISLVA